MVLTTQGTSITAGRFYRAYGAKRSGNDFAFERNYTGQHLDDTGLLYYGARYYDPAAGRFISPDTMVPDPGNVLDYNRYLYARGNPLKYNDPSGHCVDGLTTIACIFIAIGAAFLIEGSQAEAPAGSYVNVPDNANGLLGAGLMLAGVGGWTGQALFGPKMLQQATQATSVACGDGDCTNEATQLATPSRGVWDLDPFRRGVEIERLLGRSQKLADNFPVIDRFENGVATSIKSLDTTAKTYQDSSQLTKLVQGYVNTLANWNGQAVPWRGITIRSHEIQQRVLELAIPSGTSPAQYQVLQQLQQGAQNLGVRLDIIIFQ